MLLGATVYDFCKETGVIWQFIGYVLFIFKIVIPILLIVFGMMDLGKAVVASDDKEIKNATTKLAKRAVAGVVIFFIPALVGFIFSIVVGFSGKVQETYELCKDCIVNPMSEDCKNNIDLSEVETEDSSDTEKAEEN